ncbi:MAG: DUF4358 domain-containing protein [Lachnospiraceae bacterium]|nr:DUF4358 domain-containing protein [Lachnospiraceae bacterium]
MKKAITFICIMTLCMALAACGKNNQNAESSTQQSQSIQESTETQSTEATQGTESTEEVMPEIGVNGWSQEMEALKIAVVDKLGENYWPNMPVTPDIMEGLFGITADMYEDYLAEMPMISTNVDTLVIIKPKADKAQAVEDALTAYRQAKVSDTMQYPMNVGKIQASTIEKIGNYICFIQLGADTMELSEKGDDAVIKHCQEQNKLAIEQLQATVVK